MNLVATLGASALLTALAASLFAVGAAVLGQRLARPALIAAARRAIVVTAALTTLAVGVVAYALLTDDFSIAHVVNVSSRDMLPHMKWAALYSGQPGSLLFWTWLLSLMLAGFALITVPRIPWGAAHATAASGAVLAAFLVPAVFLASPFEVSAVTPGDGVGLNPLLVDPAMLVHPPFMLAGLVSTAVPFALGAAALLSGRIDGRWIRAVRPWALWSWLLLSVGNILGAWWAYTTLGWGGFWGWDPVENSAILPLLPMTAFVHSLMVQERRGMLKLWNLALVFAAFALAVFGTFNVRSGLVASVHSFALSDVGPYFLVVLAATLVASIVLLGWRSGRLRPDHDFDSLASRESALIVNNYLFTIGALVILGATIFPVFSELVEGARITVSAPFYNDVIGPLVIALLVLIAVGTVLPWRRAAGTTLIRRFRVPLAVLAGSAVVLAALGMHDRFALATTSAATALGYVTLREFAIGARGRRAAGGQSWPAALLALFERDRRRYGGYLVHVGVAVMAIAAVTANVYQAQSRGIVAPGESFEVGGYTVQFEGLRERAGTANGIETEVLASLTVRRDGETVTTLAPGRRFFRNFPEQPMAMVDVDTGWREDIYVFLQGWDEEGVAEINAFVNPLMVWLWIGAGIYVLGGIVVVGAPPPRTGARACRAARRRGDEGVTMRVARRVALGALAVVLVAVAGVWGAGGLATRTGSAGAQDFEAQALQIEQQLMCPRCINVRLDHCELTICQDMRAEIRDQLAAGRGGDDILLYFSDRFGDVVLAELPREGFNLWLFGWVGGSILLVAAIGAAALWRMRRGARLAPAGAGGALDASEERWLDEQLRTTAEGRD